MKKILIFIILLILLCNNVLSAQFLPAILDSTDANTDRKGWHIIINNTNDISLTSLNTHAAINGQPINIYTDVGWSSNVYSGTLGATADYTLTTPLTMTKGGNYWIVIGTGGSYTNWRKNPLTQPINNIDVTLNNSCAGSTSCAGGNGFQVYVSTIESINYTVLPSSIFNISGSILYNTVSFTNVSKVLLISDSTSTILSNMSTNSTGGYSFTGLSNNTRYALVANFRNTSVNYTKSVYVNLTPVSVVQNIDYVDATTTVINNVACLIYSMGCYSYEPLGCSLKNSNT